MKPSAAALYDVVDATWPAAAFHRAGPWIVREGQGGGQRVSATTAVGPVARADLDSAIARQAALGQPPIFMIRPGDEDLDGWLAARGYKVKDPVVLYLAPVAALVEPIPQVTAMTVWPPLQIQRELWAEGGIGPSRLAVMARVLGPKTAILARRDDKPAGTAFVAIHDGVAMLHALEVSPHRRRLGGGRYMMRAAANWAQANGADWISLAVTQANAGARALYASLGMEEAGNYHYRVP